jgi:hypothetical protein
MNKVALLSNVHNGQQVSLHLRKIEYIVKKKIRSPDNLSLMVPIPEGLRLDLSAKYTTPSTLSSKSSKKFFMWEVAPMSRIHASPQEENEVLNKSSVTPIFQWETT